MKTRKKTVLVTGCFDLLHSGHIAFLEEASIHGELIVGIGSDETVKSLIKGDTRSIRNRSGNTCWRRCVV